MGAWIRSLRLTVCLLASTLAIVGFMVADIKIPWSAVIAVFFIVSATMLQNDWHDRVHDARKGKTLALEQGPVFLVWMLTLWTVTVTLVVLSALQSVSLGVVLAVLVLVGGTYSNTRKVPLLPITTVALSSASPVVLPTVVGGNSAKLWLLFVATALVIFAREITKDLDDKQIDRGYKWTLPIAIGSYRSMVIATAFTVVGMVATVWVSPVTLPGATVGAIGFTGATSTKARRKYLDAGMILILLALIVV